jgi:hypothetical protein
LESGHSQSAATEKLELRQHVGGLYLAAQVLGVIGLAGAVLLGYFEGDEFKRFFYSYLVAFLFCLAIALGGLFFVMLQHVTKAGWSVSVRRIAEWYGSSLWLFALLSLPIFASLLTGHGSLYHWAVPGWSAGRGFKGWWLQPGFFVIRAAIYFAVWTIYGLWYWKTSVLQDRTGDMNLTLKMQHRAPIGLVLFGLTVTFAMWDWIMSIDPVWYSTIFGVYYFGGSALAIFSTLVLSVRYLQSKGLLVESVTTEHYHDLGKFMFGFVFFWGYIAFSQFMLQWYGNIPDETGWFLVHGGSTLHPNDFSPVVLALLTGHFLIPFPGLLSRHVKRSKPWISFWAVWCLAFCWLDMYWLVMPEYDAGTLHFGLIDIAALVGVGGIFIAFILRRAMHDPVRPTHDPRLADSLAFENF